MAQNVFDRSAHYAGTAMPRRRFFERISDGIYGTALATLLSQELYGGIGMLAPDSAPVAGLPAGHRPSYDLKPRTRDFSARTKSVIHLFMNGGPSQVDLFDPKVELDKHNGKTHSIAGGQTDIDHSGQLMRSPFAFK